MKIMQDLINVKKTSKNLVFFFLFELSEYSVDIVLEFGYSYKHLN